MKTRNYILVNIILVVCACVLAAGCAWKSTDGRAHKILPIEIQVKGALASGENENNVAIGNKAVKETTENPTTFNNAWSDAQKAEYSIETTTTTGPGCRKPENAIKPATSDEGTGKRVKNAMDMKK